MKTLFFSLISVLTFAQTQLPDSVFLVDGRSVDCLIKQIDDTKIYFLYNNNIDESIVINALDRVYLEGSGNIYYQKTGFIKNTDELNLITETRYQKLLNDQKLKAELERINLEKRNEINMPAPVLEDIKIQTSGRPMLPANNYNKWSFGVLYVPYYSGRTYELVQDPYYENLNLYGYSVSSTTLESQLAYSVLPQLKLTFDAGYSASITEDNYEYHYRYNDPNYPTNDNGYKSTSKMKKLDFNVGAKYYFNKIFTNKVSIYAAFGIGKQFAFVTEEDEVLFVEPDPQIINQNNHAEFMEDINSPFHFNIGFGAEYFFNDALSLNANIRVHYNISSGKYESRQIDPNISRTINEELTTADFTTKIGLGLNFYF